jgi:YggT family protein
MRCCSKSSPAPGPGRSSAPELRCAAAADALDAEAIARQKAPPVNTVVALLDFIVYYLLGLLKLLLIVYAIMSWLIAFNVINMYNSFVRGVQRTLERILEPLLRPIRRIIPDMGGIDLSPMVLFLLIVLIQNYLYPAIMRDLALA